MSMPVGLLTVFGLKLRVGLFTQTGLEVTQILQILGLARN
jgi:hypothetical protein